MNKIYKADKQEAIDLSHQLELDRRIEYCKVEMEPYNGWVVIAVPKAIDLSDLNDLCEVRHPAGHRLSPVPSYRRKPPQNLARTAPKTRRAAPVAPPKAPPPPPMGCAPVAAPVKPVAPPPPPPLKG